MVNNNIPKHFIVKAPDTRSARRNNELWQKFISWLNATYNSEWTGIGMNWYGHDGNSDNGTDANDFPQTFKNNPVRFESVEEFMAVFDSPKIHELWT